MPHSLSFFPFVHRALFYAVILMLLSSVVARANLKEITTQAKTEATSQSPSAEVRKLEVGKPFARELRGGESHTYEIALAAGQYVNVIVEQHGIDVVVQVIAPDGKQLVEADSPNGTQGDEPVTLITETAGNYRLTIRSGDAKAPPGNYELRLVEARTATDKDRTVQEVTRLNGEVEKLKRAGKYDAALALVEKALATAEKGLGQEHPLVAVSLNNLAETCQAKGDFAKAEPLYLRALAITEKAHGAEHALVADIHGNLGAFYFTRGEYAKAEQSSLRALAIRQKLLGAEHTDIALSLNNLAVIYIGQGDLAKAEPPLMQALAIREKALGKEHPDVGETVNNLGGVNRERGDFTKAEAFYLRGLAIREKSLGKEHPSVAESLSNLGSLYKTKGDYSKAEQYLLSSFTMREKALGAKHPVVGASCNNLAETYRAMGDYAKAAPYYERAITIAEEAFGKEHPNVTTSLNNLGMLYRNQGDLAKAEPLLIRTLAIREKTLGKEHFNVAVSLGNLASVYYAKGEYDKAEPLLLRALAIREKVLGNEHPNVTLSLNNLAKLYEAKGDFKQAIAYQSRCNDATESDLTRNLASGSERQKLLYLNQTRSYVDLTISLHTRFAPNDAKALRAAVTVLLQRKGRALDAMADTIEALRRRASKDDQALLEQLSNARSRLAIVTLRGPGRTPVEKHQANLKLLGDEVERLENDIAQRSVEFRSQSQKVTIEAVQKAIPAGAALVDFALYQQAEKAGEAADKPHYVAYILRRQGEPLWVELGEAQAIDAAISRLRQALRDKRRLDVKRLARAVDRRVMQPVRHLLGKTQRVLLSPDGSLNLIPFAALVDERGAYLVKRYTFTYLTSGRDLLRLQTKLPSKQMALVMADADFNGNAGDEQTAADESARLAQRTSEAPGPRLGEVKFEPLARLTATADEATKVKNSLPEAMLYLRREATESRLKQVSSPAILHIATHGFFLDQVNQTAGERTRLAIRKGIDDELPADVPMDNPLLRSGLFLANANLGKSGDDDGTLTASEAAGLDLWGTKLVVLSACDTGIGKVVSGDGVYGLRRALVLAGSESQMMSLWAVSDQGTQELMIDYYKRLQRGEGRSAALRNVQLKMLTTAKRQHPFYWASFIQSGEWANLEGKREDR